MNYVDENLFFKLYRNKVINRTIWNLVNNRNGQDIERVNQVQLGYYELYDTELIFRFNGVQVFKEKVERGEYIHFSKLTSNLFYVTKCFGKQFFETLITNYHTLLQCHKNLFQSIVTSGNVDSLNVFLQEKRWEFKRNKTQLGDCAISSGDIEILKCLKENNEIQVTTGQTLYNNLISSKSSVIQVYNYCIDNKIFSANDLIGTELNIESLIERQLTTGSSSPFDKLKFIYQTKQFIKFNGTMDIFSMFDVFSNQEYTLNYVILVLNIHSYLRNIFDTTKPFIELKEFNGEENIKITKSKTDKPIIIPLVKKLIEILMNNLSNKNSRLLLIYLVYTGGEMANIKKLLKKEIFTKYIIFETSYQFCDLNLLKSFCGNKIGNGYPIHFDYSLFQFNKESTIKERNEYLKYIIENSERKLSSDNWYSLFERLLFSDDIKSIEYLLVNHNHYFNDHTNHSHSFNRLISNKPLIVNGFDSFKLIFKYYIDKVFVIFKTIINQTGTDEKTFQVMDWLIQQVHHETGKPLIDRNNPIYMDSLLIDPIIDQVYKIKYFTENGFSCTYDGIYKCVITFNHFESFKYLVENRNESVINSGSPSNLLWIGQLHYLQLKCKQDPSTLKRFPLSSHPKIEYDDFYDFYLSTFQNDQLFQLFDSRITQHFTNDSDSGEYYQDWEFACLNFYIKFCSIEFIDSLFKILFQYLNFKSNTITRLSRFVNPLLECLVSGYNLPALEYIFENWSPIFNSEHSLIFNHKSLLAASINYSSIEIFNFFVYKIKISLSILDDTALDQLITKEDPIIYYLYNHFTNFNFSFGITKKDDWF